jgi:hypothetical protein
MKSCCLQVNGDVHFKWSKPVSEGKISCNFTNIQKLDKKDKCTHKYIYDYIYNIYMREREKIL